MAVEPEHRGRVMDGQDDLSFTGHGPAFDDFVSRLGVAGGEWVRDTDYEARRARIFGRPLPGVQFTHHDDSGVTDALLRLDPRKVDEWDVSVVPGRVTDPFGPDDWNRLLSAFAAHAASHARAAGLKMIGPWRRPIDLRDYTTYTTAALAEEFRSSTDPVNLSAADLARWRAFTILAYRDDQPPNREVIRDWLIQHGWEPTRAATLVDEYGTVMDILSQYQEAARV